MVVCASEGSYCEFTIIFGTFSIICLVIVDFELIIYNKNPHIVVLFIPRALCISMILEYFVNINSESLYFIKEYLLLIGICTTSYYFTFQAYNLLKDISIVKYTILGSIVFYALSLIAILIVFAITLPMGTNGIPCNDVVWLVMRILGALQALLFVIVSVLVKKKVSKFASFLHQQVLAERFNCLRLFTSIVVVSTALKLIETIAYYISEEENCFLFLSNQDIYPVIFYSIAVLISDYSIIFSALYFFYKNKNGLVISRPTTLSEFDTSNNYNESLEFDSRHRSSSINDYILYSN
ncbi:hypothetical protein SteCoe_13626 [Stentor coeruleus]|uniref:Uncharacterized protein n=1 Tax=Stentor coeruleus TaxID=5963 RepID=A0A1R2C7W3_9CILI|nr:hypothetical protein SteCoe_13626 [Stentor coeruleus]